MDRSFVIGDKVLLISRNSAVARGVIQKTDPEATCHFVKLGVGRSAVFIIEALNERSDLQFPHEGAGTVGECLGSICLWDNGSMVISLPCDQLGSGCHERASASTGSDGGLHDRPLVDFSKRTNWLQQDVYVLCQSSCIIIGNGIVALSNPASFFQGSRLGDDYVAILLHSTTLDHNSSERMKWFPLREEGQATFVKWPIEYLMFAKTRVILANVEVRDDTNVSSIVPYGSRKRIYCFKTRNRGDSERKRIARCKSKAFKRIGDREIDDVARVICCKLHCTRSISRDDIKDARLEYYGVSVSERWKTIYGYFRDREERHQNHGLMIFRGLPICKDAFCSVFGIAVTTFYQRRIECLQDGAKVGHHGNSGSKKPLPATLFARAMLQAHLQSNSECMPHETYNGCNGTDSSIYKLPSSIARKDIYKCVNDDLQQRQLSRVSNNTLRTLWKENFANYQIHSTSAFAKCSICTQLKDQLQHKKRTEQRNAIQAEKQAHIDEALSRRAEYYANRLKALRYPSEYLSMIHDKMDQAKTWIPRVSQSSTKLQMGHALPMALTGMLLHGRSPGVLAHWSVRGLFPGDPDFTVSSLAKAFRDLEVFNGDMSGDLSFSPTTTSEPIFSALLDRNPILAKFRDSTDPSNDWRRFVQQSPTSRFLRASVGYNTLPKHLLLQMDNSGKDNKNQTVMAFCSELVARGIFVSVTLSFLMVGHTHEDIDAFFSKVSLAMKGKDISTFPDLMAEVASCQTTNPINSIIQEVAHYSAYVKPFVKEIAGQSAPIAFYFTMKNNRPVYQIKETLRSPWMPPMGRVIWKERVKDSPEQGFFLPDFDDEPKPKPVKLPTKDITDVEIFLKNFLEMKRCSARDPSSDAYRINTPLIQYWQTILDLLKNGSRTGEIAQASVLQTKFWPRTNHGTGFKMDNDCAEDDAEILHPLEVEQELVNRENDEMFVGARSEKLRTSFTPLVDIADGSFVLIRPHANFEREHPRRIWLVRARSKIIMDKNSKHFGKFQIEWWRPTHRKVLAHDAERYANCLPTERKSQVWEQDPLYPKENIYWQLGTAAIYSWKTTAKRITLSSDRIVDAVQAYLAEIDGEDDLVGDESDSLEDDSDSISID